MTAEAIEAIHASLASGRAIPFFGPGVLALAGDGCLLPATLEALADRLTAKASVPHKIRKNPTAAAQFIENFKHRKTVVAAMKEAFSAPVEPTALHRYLASLPALRMIVHAWYDDLPQKALAGRKGWGMVQGVSKSEHRGEEWTHCFCGERRRPEAESRFWMPLLYQPVGSVSPAANFLVSDSDFVEVLTEIDIQTPIPKAVQDIRKGRSFLFLGCRFATQLERILAEQIIKRSSARHWAVLPEEPTRNEARFLAHYGIQRIATPLPDFVALLTGGSVDVHEAGAAVA